MTLNRTFQIYTRTTSPYYDDPQTLMAEVYAPHAERIITAVWNNYGYGNLIAVQSVSRPDMYVDLICPDADMTRHQAAQMVEFIRGVTYGITLTEAQHG